MRSIGAAAFLVLVGAMPALAAELPSRKPGLWQVKMSIGDRNVPAPDDQAMHRRRHRPDDAVERRPLCTGRVLQARRAEVGEFDHDRFHLRRSTASQRRRTRSSPAASTAPIR